MADQRGYSAGKFLLEIDGKDSGFLFSVEGGEPFATVVPDAPDGGQVVRKHLGAVAYEPIRVTFDTGMSEPLYQWISDWLGGQAPAKNGAIVFLDYNFREQSRLTFRDALITEVVFPAADGSSRDPARITLTLQPATTSVATTPGGAKAAVGAKAAKRPLASNFRLTIGEFKTARVSTIEPLIVRQAVDPEGGAKRPSLEIPDLVFTIAESDSKDFVDRFDAFVTGAEVEQKALSATIEWLDAALKTPLFTLTLSGLGIFRIHRLRSEAGAEVIARARVAMFCEQMAFDATPDAAGAVVPPAAPPPPAAPDVLLAGALLGLLGDRFPNAAALSARIALAGAKPGETPDPELIARRLAATVQVEAPSASEAPRRDAGEALGVRWASQTATLGELQQIAALEPRDWSAVSLAQSHSLTGLLVSEGLAPPGADDGAVELERDAFVEGIVAGTSKVLRLASPHLTP